MTLTEQAKAARTGRRYDHKPTFEEQDLALAWANSEITTAQLATVLDKDPNPAVYWAANTIRQSIGMGTINITKGNH